MATDLAAVAKRLPPELRVRASEDADLERTVEFQNRWADAGRWMSPPTVRAMWTAMPDPSRFALLVEDAGGQIQAIAVTSSGGPFAPPDGSWRVTLRVAPEWRRRGVARSLLERIEAHARERSAKRLISPVRGDEPEGAAFAESSGYRAFHQRIDSYIEVATFDASKFDDPDEIARRAGVELATFAEKLSGASDAVEAFQRELVKAVWEMARDVPSPTPIPEQPPPFEQARKMFFEGPGNDRRSTIVALRDGQPVGMTATMVKENGAAYTSFTGVARSERGKGLALAMKLRALRELRARGVKLFGTTNDESNAAMRGINQRLGYVPEAPTTMYEKRFS
ncbi:MAG: GNAT family N-acetyltransferase [Candidatus Limnocylindria bacterium]